MEIQTEEIECAIVLSVLGRKQLTIRRESGEDVSEEIEDLLRLIAEISDGFKYSIKGNTVEVYPGSLRGGSLSFTPRHASVPYLLHSLLPLSPFTQSPLRVTLLGPTNGPAVFPGAGTALGNRTDMNRANPAEMKSATTPSEKNCATPLGREFPSTDCIKAVHCKILKDFGTVCDVSIKKRSLYPSRNGEVLFLSETSLEMEPIRHDRREKLKRIVCINYSARISGDIPTRLTNSLRDALRSVTQRIKIYNDIGSRQTAGNTPGYGTLLVASGRNSRYYTEECWSQTEKEETTPDTSQTGNIGGKQTNPKKPPAQRKRGKGFYLFKRPEAQSAGQKSAAEPSDTFSGTAPPPGFLQTSPETRALEQSRRLLSTIRHSGAYDHKLQSFIFVLLSVTRADASSFLIRKPGKKDRETLRLLEEILKYTYTIEKYTKSKEDANSGVSDSLFVFKSYGSGLANIYKKRG